MATIRTVTLTPGSSILVRLLYPGSRVELTGKEPAWDLALGRKVKLMLDVGGKVTVLRAGDPAVRSAFTIVVPEGVPTVTKVPGGGFMVKVRFFGPADPPPSPTAVRAFPSAEGHGASSLGGRGADPVNAPPTLYRVTTLADSGAGSLRAAIDATGPRFVVFDVAGDIEVASILQIDSPYIYIAGQTAPRGGICIRAAAGFKQQCVKVMTNDVIIRHLRLRMGFVGDQYPSPTAGSAGQAARAVGHEVGARNIVWDHCSVTWATDGNFETDKDTHDVSIQWCIIAEALHNAGHTSGGHGRPLNFSFAEDEVGADTHKNITLHHSLIAHGEERLPQIATGVGKVEVIGNVIYASRDMAINVNTNPNGVLVSPKLRFIKNFFKRINTATGSAPIRISPPARGPDVKMYVNGNVGPGRPTGAEAEWLIVEADDRSVAMGGTASDDPVTVTDPTCGGAYPLAAIPVTVEADAFDVYDMVLDTTPGRVGATLPLWDAVDQRIVTQAIDNTGAVLINHPGETVTPNVLTRAGGYPDLTVGGSATLWSAPASPMAVAGNGYLNIENSLNALAGDTIP